MIIAVLAIVLAIAIGMAMLRRAQERRLQLPDLPDLDEEPIDAAPILIPVSRQPVARERLAEPRAPAPTPAPASISSFRPEPPSSPRLPSPPPAREFEGTLQLLPGRLEVLAGEDNRREFRFVRTGAVTEVTIGRGEGPLHSHLQLGARTVSRLHARLRYGEEGWSIANLSPTNPVVVNGRQLNGESVPLHDGDQVELGAVVLRFHPR